MTPKPKKQAFVTVGTTRFDALIQAMTTPDALTTLAAQGFTHLLLQIGASPEPAVGTPAAAVDDEEDVGEEEEAEEKGSSTGTPHLRRRPKRSSDSSSSSSSSSKEGRNAEEEPGGSVAVSWYRYKDSLRAEMEGADLIVSHAGAGSVMEALDLGKALLVVVNTGLMDDHQQELARAMEEQGYLEATEPPQVLKSLQNYHQWHGRLKPRPPPTLGLLPALLDQEMGFVRGEGGGGGEGGETNEEGESRRRQSGRLRGSGGGGGGVGTSGGK